MSGTVMQVGVSSQDNAASKSRNLSMPAHRARQIMLASVFIAGFVALASQLTLQSLYAGRFYPGVKIAGMNVGGLSRPQAMQLIKKQVEGYRLQFNVGSTSYRIKPEEAGARYDIGATLDDALAVGRGTWAPLGMVESSRTASHGLEYHVDPVAEKAFIDTVVAKSGLAPIDAAVTFANGVPTVVGEKSGWALNAEQVKQTIHAELPVLSAKVPTLQPSVQTAEIKAPDVASTIGETKSLMATPITVTYQGRTFQPTATQMSEWFTYHKSTDAKPHLIPVMNPDGIKHYLQSVASQINQNPVSRKVNVENGVQKETQPGKDGLALDVDTLVDQLAKATMAKQAFSVEAPTKPVPFKTEYNNFITLDYGRYIDVNLSKQHLYVFQDHNIIFDSPITSGASGAGFPTITGMFSVQAKQTNRYLNGQSLGPGYNYNVFVHYWMPFSGNYGLHDASWRHGSFGGSDYYYGGSHGCVNLPDATAAYLYNWADVGTPVWVHR